MDSCRQGQGRSDFPPSVFLHGISQDNPLHVGTKVYFPVRITANSPLQNGGHYGAAEDSCATPTRL